MVRLLSILTIVLSVLILGNSSVFAAQVEGSGAVEGTTSNASANAVCEGANIIDGGGSCTEQKGNTVAALIKNVINIISWIVGVVAVFMIILGGFSIITANGDSQRIGKARNAILYAIVGLVVVLISQLIVFFVLSRF